MTLPLKLTEALAALAAAPVAPLRAPWEGPAVVVTIALQHWQDLSPFTRLYVEAICHRGAIEYGAVKSISFGPLAVDGEAHRMLAEVCEAAGVVALVERVS